MTSFWNYRGFRGLVKIFYISNFPIFHIIFFNILSIIIVIFRLQICNFKMDKNSKQNMLQGKLMTKDKY